MVLKIHFRLVMDVAVMSRNYQNNIGNPCLSISYHSSTLLETLHSTHCFGSFGLMAIDVDDFVSITKVKSYQGRLDERKLKM